MHLFVGCSFPARLKLTWLEMLFGLAHAINSLPHPLDPPEAKRLVQSLGYVTLRIRKRLYRSLTRVLRHFDDFLQATGATQFVKEELGTLGGNSQYDWAYRCVLRMNRLFLCTLGLSAALWAQTSPNEVDQDRIIASMHQYAEDYVRNLPNFLCLQTTRQFEGGLNAKHLKKGDVLVSRLTFNAGREHRALDLVNGKPPQDAKHRWRMPLTTEGEFGMLLNQVLARRNAAVLRWNRWDMLRGKRLAVFDYTVDEQHSSLSLRLSDLANAIVPYTGTIFADPDTGEVWRISDTASDIPVELQTREISTTIDYGPIQIGGRNYLLPIEASIDLVLRTGKVRNELEFGGYRKFEADSVITFDSDSSNK